MTTLAANKVAEETLKASRDANAFFERFDKAILPHAAAHGDIDWLLSEKSEAFGQYPLIGGLQSPSPEGEYTLLIPHSAHKPLYLQELHQIVRELVEGIFVFNQTPCIQFAPNHDCSTSCFIPSAYHDTLVGETLLEVDYFVKSLLHGTTVAQKDKRHKLIENWRKMAGEAPHVLRENFSAAGLVRMEEDKELGSDLYMGKKQPFIRYPPKCVDSDLAYNELSPRLSTGEEFMQQEDHLSRDMFLRYLDQVNISLVFRQQSIRQEGAFLLLEPSFDVTTGVHSDHQESQKELFCHLHSYLQKQRDFVVKNLLKRREIAHSLELLEFISFMVPFLITLKKQNKVIDVTHLLPSVSKDRFRTNRELPPVFPSESSRWSPFTAENSYTSMHGGIFIHKLQQSVQKPGKEFAKMQAIISEAKFPSKSTLDEQSYYKKDLSMCPLDEHSYYKKDLPMCPLDEQLYYKKDLPMCTLNEQSYYILSLHIENYYSKSPKLPRWLHAMITELGNQCSRLPVITDSRAQDLLRKPCGPRQAAKMKTVNALLQASIEKGVLPAVVTLLKRCTQTRLNKVDESGKALIHHAAVHCRADALSALILAGSNVNLPCHSADQLSTATLPIHLAAQSGGLEAVCCLLRFGAELTTTDNDGWAPVHHAAFHNYQAIVLHFASADPNCIDLQTTDKGRSTPLLLASRNSGYDTVMCLVKLGANLKATDSSNRNVVHIAAQQHHINILKYLIDLAHPSLDVWGELSAMLAANTGMGYPEAAARCMDPLTRWQPSHYGHLLKHSAVGSLVALLKGKDEKIQHLSMQVLANISNIEGIKVALVRADAIPPLVKLLTSTNDRIQANTCIILSDLGVIADNQVAVAKVGAIPHLVKLLGSENDDVQLYSCACLGILAYDHPENQASVSEASGLSPLIQLLSSDLSCIQACAASTLEAVLEGNRPNQLSALSLNAISFLVALLRSKKVSVHSNAARAIEALAENCEESQRELLGNSTCISLLKRLLRMRNPEIKVCGGCALWAIAGSLTSNQRLIATYMGLELLVDMLTVHNEKLDFVCSEALGSLATELGDNQDRIATVGGLKPLVDILTMPTSQRVCLSVIHTLSAVTMKPALVPNPDLQKAIANARGIVVLASIVSSQAAEIIRVEAACTLAKLVLNNPDNDMYLTKHTDFSYRSIFKFFTSSTPIVRLLAGYCLAIMAFNNSVKLEQMRAYGSLNIANFTPFLCSVDEFQQAHAAFQVVVLAKLLSGIRDVEAMVRGIRLLVELCSSEAEQTKVLSAEFLASLAHSSGGIPNTIIMAGALDPLLENLRSGNGPAIESACVALGYLTFNPMASRLILGTFRDDPELYDIFKGNYSMVVMSKKFLEDWSNAEKAGLPALR